MNNHLSFFFYIIFLYRVNCVIVYTKQGALEGEILRSRAGRPFYAFYGIPYAEPPLGELRFKSPLPPKPWTSIRDASVLPPPCLSFEDGKVVGEEDCLYLNLYTPKLNNESALPVMVFIYGGRFMFGHALPNRYGPHYFMDKDVILITFHYRIGALGFLSTEDEVIPGNYGLKDAVAVLQWVQNHVEAFGGDKNRVTLFGGSSGATSVSLVLLSPSAKGLFHRVISQSGQPLDIEKPGTAKRTAWKFGSIVGCCNETSQELLTCLQNLPAETIAEKIYKLFTLGYLLPALPWSPVIENEKVPGAFLIDEPRKLLARESDIPWMMGVNSDDGSMMAIFLYCSTNKEVLNELDKNYDKYFPYIFRYGYNVNSTEKLNYVTEMYKRYYFGDKNIREDIHGFAKMFTGLIYLPGIKEIVKLYKGPKFVYYFNHRHKESFASFYGSCNEEMGVVHGDELISMFNWSEIITPVTEGIDLVVSEQMIELWTNFAANGDPNNGDEVIWKPTKTTTIDYLHIKDGLLQFKNEFLKQEFNFLESVPVSGYF